MCVFAKTEPYDDILHSAEGAQMGAIDTAKQEGKDEKRTEDERSASGTGQEPDDCGAELQRYDAIDHGCGQPMTDVKEDGDDDDQNDGRRHDAAGPKRMHGQERDIRLMFN